MRILHTHHFIIAIALFCVATVLYAIGAEYGAVAALVLACIVEAAALYVFTIDRSRNSSPDGKS